MKRLEDGLSSLRRTGTDSTESPSNAELHYILTPFRGQAKGETHTRGTHAGCPEQTGYTWRYYDDGIQDWKDAGEGIQVKCAGQ